MIAPGVNSSIGIYCFDSKESSRRTFRKKKYRNNVKYYYNWKKNYLLFKYILAIKGFSHWTQKFTRECSSMRRFWIETIDPYGLFTPGTQLEKAKFFFSSCVSFFFPVARDEMGRPIRFELRSRAWSSSVAQKGKEWGRCLENQCKHNRREYSERFRERREWMPSSCYLWYLSTDLFSHVSPRIMWSGVPFSSTCASVMNQRVNL